MRKEVEDLLRQARRGLENAEKIVATEAYEVSAFLCHQGVEKYLKALWILRNRRRPPPTHNLKDLGEGLGAPGNLMSRLRFLNPDYTVSRYPDAANGVPYEMYDEPTARQKIEAAREIASWAESQIPS